MARSFATDLSASSTGVVRVGSCLKTDVIAYKEGVSGQPSEQEIVIDPDKVLFVCDRPVLSDDNAD